VQLSGITPALQTAADISLGALTAATGWARIEAGAHYPSDTLVGASIGDFFANLFADALLAPTSARLRLASLPGGAELQLGLSF
jgi:membrane-associated phospholipid phosphatase